MKTAEDILKSKGGDIVTVSPEATIQHALKKMISSNIGSIFVKEKDKIIGVWTERDLMHNVMESEFSPRNARISDYMTTDLYHASYSDSIFSLLDKFLGKRLRHLLIQKEGEYIGVLSTGDVMKASLNLKSSELQELNAIVSWEYYENWRWEK
ncbi:CBS domain-containing protein [candidate division KSB1 bacterium]|nr:CBS domain-containing protein [candidate division KSB1 bacterium]